MSEDRQKQIMTLIAAMEREAYKKGWDDAVRNILAAASAPVPRQSSKETEVEKPSPPQYETPIIDIVYDIVTKRPGFRGHEVVKAIVARDPSIEFKVADRTGRTSLSRLRKRQKIVQRNGRWYPAEETKATESSDKENEPAVGSLALSEPGWRNG